MKLTRKEARKILNATFPDYRGRSISLEFRERVQFYNTNWEGGSRNYYSAVNVNGVVKHLPDFAPWDNPVEGNSFDLPVDVAVVMRTYFCGKDSGVTIFMHPVNAPKWITGGV
jgi:hypothetical protein